MKIIFDYNRTIFDPEKQELYSGVLELINELAQKHELFLVSANEPERKNALENFGISRFFKKIVFTDNKSVEIFQEMVGTDSEVLVVGDRIRGEIVTGNKLNFITVWVKQGRFSFEGPMGVGQKPKYTISNIVELREIVKKYE